MSSLGYDENGKAIMTMEWKLEALHYCINVGNAEEDVLCHLGEGWAGGA